MTEAIRLCKKYGFRNLVYLSTIEGDDHLLPTLGLMDWKAYMSYMRENGYKGNYTLELVYGHIPRELMDPFLSFSKDIVEYLMTL